MYANTQSRFFSRRRDYLLVPAFVFLSDERRNDNVYCLQFFALGRQRARLEFDVVAFFRYIVAIDAKECVIKPI